ncbi:MAG: hypothetical protein H6Q72_4118 [Firmicutes bacterium]|nr:hypothetical protein [Bacillota bacterium]
MSLLTDTWDFITNNAEYAKNKLVDGYNYLSEQETKANEAIHASNEQEYTAVSNAAESVGNAIENEITPKTKNNDIVDGFGDFVDGFKDFRFKRNHPVLAAIKDGIKNVGQEYNAATNAENEGGAAVVSDVGNSIANYGTGAIQGYQEVARENNRFDAVAMYDSATGKYVPKPGYSQEDVDTAQTLLDKANSNFRNETLYPGVMAAGVAAAPFTAGGSLAAEAAFGLQAGEGLYKGAQEATQQGYGPATSLGLGIKSIWLDPLLQTVNAPDFQQKLAEHPAATIANVVMGGVNVAVPIFGAYGGLKGLKGKPTETGKEGVVTEADRPTIVPPGEIDRTPPPEVQNVIDGFGEWRRPSNNEAAATSETSAGGDNIITTAEQQLGKPYQLGGDGTDTTDCGKFTLDVFAQNGIELNTRRADLQFKGLEEQGKTFDDPSQLQPGDLVFFKNTYSDNTGYKEITHVGIYAGDGKMLHAGSHGVGYTDLNTDYWQSKIAGYGRPLDGEKISLEKSPVAAEKDEADTIVLSEEENQSETTADNDTTGLERSEAKPEMIGEAPTTNIDTEKVSSFVDNALDNPSKFETMPLREVTPEEAATIKKLTHVDVDGFTHEISTNEIRHAINEHGNEIKESERGQLPLTADDLKKIPEIINSYDSIKKGSPSGSHQSVIYQKRINGSVYYVEAVIPKKGVLRSKTMWKKPSAQIVPEKSSPPYTSESNGARPTTPERSLTSSKTNISAGKGKVNGRQPLTMEQPPTYMDKELTQKLGEGKLGDVERDLANTVNKEIEPVNLPIGMTVKETKGIAEPTKGVKFSDPEIEKRWQEASKGLKKESIISKVKEAVKTFWQKSTRVFEDLPNSAEFSQLKNDLLYLQKQKAVAGDRTTRLLQGITIKLDKPGLDLFTRKVILDDLAKTEGDLPFGLTPKTLTKEKSLVDNAVKDNPVVAEAVANRKRMQEALKQDYIQAMKDIGFDVSDRMNREDYFRHQVLDYANLRAVTGTGQRLKTPTNRGFLKGREGSEMDINANYLQAEFEVVAQMIHDTELARTIKKVDKNYSIRNELFDTFGDKWRENIPDGYTLWQPREGSSFYMANSIPETLASKLLGGALEEVGVSADQVRQVLAKGSPFKELVVKDEVAKTLNKISEQPADNFLSKYSKKLLGLWKVWTLISPTRIIKYNLRNVTGDADALFTMNRTAFLRVPQATKELYQTIYGDRAMSPEMGEWFRRGGMETTSPVQELTDINGLRMFEKFADKDPNFIKKAWEKYWGTANRATQFREAIFRYATYLDYLKQMQEKGGRPKNFGASKPEEIMALPDIRDRAFKLSNDVLGAYDNISVIGKELREHIWPFWSFVETNFKRYAQFFKNQKDDSWTGVGAAISRKLVGNVLIRSPYYAYALGTFTVKAGIMWGALQAYNNLMFPSEENELPPDEQASPHIILGRDKDGKVRYFNRLGSIPDFLEWFGLDTPVKDIKDYLDGSRSMKEIAIDWGKSPVNKVAQGMSPFIKSPFEMLSGKKLYPDVFNPKTIHDNGQYIADSLGLGNEFKSLSKTDTAQALGINPRPSKPYFTENTGENFIYYKSDPSQVAYYNIQDKKRDFLKDIGKGGDGDFSSPKSDALRNYKMALRLKDEQSAAFYLDQYTKLGGNKKGLKKSLDSLDPLSGLNKADKVKFKQSLNGEQLKELEKANIYYKTVMLGK